MHGDIRYIQNSLAVTFTRQATIRRDANKFEDALREQYAQPNVLAIPDELDPEVPRIIFSSRHGFSQILISQMNMTLNVRYSPDWQTDVSKGREYLVERVQLLTRMLDLLRDADVLFWGLTTVAHVSASDDDEALLQRLASIVGIEAGASHLHDLERKVVWVHEDTYYNHLTIKNYRTWRGTTPAGELHRLARADAIERGLTLVGDFNDRFAFNERAGYRTSPEAGKAVVEKGLEVFSAEAARIGEAIHV